MKQRKIPMRKCVVSGEMYPKKELVRIVRNKEGQIAIDPTGKMSGRGAYIALDPKVAKQAWKRHSLNRAFNTEVSDEFYQELVDYTEHIKTRQELFADE